MRIAFVAVNRETMPDAVVPLGLLYVMANTPAEHETTLIDLCFAEHPQQLLADRLAAFAPDLVAVGIRNIQNNTYTGSGDNLAYYRRCMATIRTATAAPVVLGGGGFSVMPAGLMRDLGADYGVAGEGERAFAALVTALEDGSMEASRGHIPGLLSSTPDRVVENPLAASFQDLDALKRPDRGLVDPHYFAEYGIDSIQTKRGCPLRCTYCTYPLIEGRSIRARKPQAVVDELFAMRETHPDLAHVFVVDSVFNLPTEHAEAICREMIARGWDVPWTAYANPIGFTDRLAELMARAGCAGLEIGSDSGCDDVLARLRKGFTTAQIRTTHRICSQAGLPDCHTFVLGTTGESLDDVRRTLEFVVDLDPFAAILMIWTDDGEALNPQLAGMRATLRDEIRTLLGEQRASFPRWVIPPMGTNFDPRLFRLLRRRGLRGPLWQHLRLIGNDARSQRLARRFTDPAT